MTLDEIKQQAVEEFKDTFLYHPYGVFKDGQVEHPEFKPLTIKNVSVWLRQTLDKVAEAAQEQHDCIQGNKPYYETGFEAGKAAAVKEIGGLEEVYLHGKPVPSGLQSGNGISTPTPTTKVEMVGMEVTPVRSLEFDAPEKCCGACGFNNEPNENGSSCDGCPCHSKDKKTPPIKGE